MGAVEPRPTHGQITFKSTFIKTRVNKGKSYRERMVKLQCACGKPMQMPLSKWQHHPPERCQKCSIRRNRDGLFLVNKW